MRVANIHCGSHNITRTGLVVEVAATDNGAAAATSKW